MLRNSIVVGGIAILAGGLALAFQPAGNQPLPASTPPIPSIQPETPKTPGPGITIEQVKPTMYYVAISKQGKAWVKGKPIREQPGLDEHVAYLSKAMADNKLLMAGPFTDESGGMAIWKVKDIGEAKAAVAGDPAVKSGLMECEVKEWVPALASVIEKPVAKPTGDSKPAAKPMPVKDGSPK